MSLSRLHVLNPALAWFCCVCVLLQASKAAAVDLRVTTTSGPILGMNETVGTTGKNALKYLGIPFAKAKRFENPTDPDAWNMTRNATKFGKLCPQPSLDPAAPLAGLAETSEDCLFINVFAPAEMNGTGLTVMVWVHGGAFVVGGGGKPSSDGGVLAVEEGVIVVTFNYRLGALGLLSAGKDSNLKGNYGMMDQVHALKWVKNNIKNFGGDANKVTLFGAAAGGMSVSLLILSPLTTGLYKHAILESGAAPGLYTALLDKEAYERSRSFAKAIGCPARADLKDFASTKNISDIIRAQIKVNSTLLLAPFAPVVDGVFLKDSPVTILKEGKYEKQGNVMIGVTRDEGSAAADYVPGVQQKIDYIDQGLTYSDFENRVNSTLWVRNQNKEMLKSIFQEYTNWANTSDRKANRQSYLDLFADSLIKAPAISSAQMYVKKGTRTYFYQFDYGPEVDQNNKVIPEWRRVPHRADIPYVFGHPLLNSSLNENNTEVQLSKKVMKYWATFAKTGNPNPSSAQNAITWPPYTTANQQYLSLEPTPEAKSNLLPGKMNFWNSFLGSLKTEEKKPCPKDLTEELNEKESIILGLAIAVGVLGLLVIIIFIIVIIYIKGKSKSLSFDHNPNSG